MFSNATVDFSTMKEEISNIATEEDPATEDFPPIVSTSNILSPASRADRNRLRKQKKKASKKQKALTDQNAEKALRSAIKEKLTHTLQEKRSLRTGATQQASKDAIRSFNARSDLQSRGVMRKIISNLQHLTPKELEIAKTKCDALGLYGT